MQTRLKEKESHFQILRPNLCCSNQDFRFGSDTDQWNKIKSPEIDLQKDGSLIFGKGEKAIKWKNGSLFTKYFETIGNLCVKNTYFDLYPVLY